MQTISPATKRNRAERASPLSRGTSKVGEQRPKGFAHPGEKRPVPLSSGFWWNSKMGMETLNPSGMLLQGDSRHHRKPKERSVYPAIG